jgi:hypothetical protein
MQEVVGCCPLYDLKLAGRFASRIVAPSEGTIEGDIAVSLKIAQVPDI